MATVEKAKMNSNAVEDSLARVFFAADSEAAINEQINHEYTMSYVYHAVSHLAFPQCIFPQLGFTVGKQSTNKLIDHIPLALANIKPFMPTSSQAYSIS